MIGVSRLLSVLASVLAIVGGMAAWATAAMIPLASADFMHLYEAADLEGLPENTAGYVIGASGNSTAAATGGILTYDTFITDNLSGGHRWTATDWPAESDDALGWTIEVRVRIGPTSIIPERPGAGAFVISVGDGVDGALIFIRESDATIGWPTLGNYIVLDTGDNTDDFHVFRIMQDSHSGLLQIWRDGSQIATDLLPGGPSLTFDRLLFGDGTSYADGRVHLDYFRWDASGAFTVVPPVPGGVPEPTSLALIGLGGGLALARRRRIAV